jgi:hypothetical protein
MSDYVVKIERLANGYEVEMSDPKIIEQNRKSKSSWKDPKVCYAFKTVDEVIQFLQANLDKAMPMDEYETNFDEAMKESEDD